MSDTPETDGHLRRNTGNGSEWVRADFARKLERALVEARQQERIHYDNLLEARSLAQAGYAKAERAEEMLRAAAAKADQWRKCAEGLAWHLRQRIGVILNALAEFERLKDATQ